MWTLSSGFKKFMRYMFVLLFIVFTLWATSYPVLNHIFSKQLAEKMSELKAKGRPMIPAEIAPAKIPDGENAALIYQKISDITKEYGSEKFSGEMRVLNDLLKTDFLTWQKAKKQEVSALVYSPQMQKIYTFAKEASQRKKCRFPIDYEKGFAAKIPNYMNFRDTCRLLSARAILEADTGHVSDALNTIIIGLKTANHLKHDPIVIGQMIRIACDRMLLLSLNEIARTKNIPEYKAVAIMNELSTHTDIKPFLKTMDSERILGTSVFTQFLEGRQFTEDISIYFESIGLKIYTHFFKPILKKEMERYLHLMEVWREKIDQPYYEAKAGLEKNPVEKQIPRYCLITRITMPNFVNVVKRNAEHQAIIAIAKIGLGLEIYKERHAAYPNGLDELVPSILKEIPDDPCTGEKLVYKKVKNGFVLYSLGVDGKDDNGKPMDLSTGSDAGDIVWKSEK